MELSLAAQTVKNLPAAQENSSSIHGLGDPLKEGNGYPFPYSFLENAMDKGD